MKPVTAWAAYRDGRLLYESMRGAKQQVALYCKALFETNKICTLDTLEIEICKITIIEGWQDEKRVSDE